MYYKHPLTAALAGMFTLVLITVSWGAGRSPVQNLEQAKFRVHEMLEALKPDPRPDYDKAQVQAIKAKDFLEAAYKDVDESELSHERKDHARDYILRARSHLDDAIRALSAYPTVETGIVADGEAAHEAIIKAIDAVAD